ncbi:MAG: DciA family protein [Phycisphaerae bacterium]
MFSDGRLAWVQRNRVRRGCSRERRLGYLAASVARGLHLAGDELAPTAASIIAEVVDEEFKAHCRLASVHNGRIVINVDQPALVYHMRMRWLELLTAAFSADKAARSIVRVVFEYGEGGVVWINEHVW